SKVAKGRVDIARAAPAPNLALDLVIVRPADVHAGAVVKEDLHRLGVVDGLSRHLRVDTAGVVGEHASEAAVVVRGGARTVGETVRPGGVDEVVADDARQDPSVPL